MPLTTNPFCKEKGFTEKDSFKLSVNAFFLRKWFKRKPELKEKKRMFLVKVFTGGKKVV
jgi:hypothetical protein